MLGCSFSEAKKAMQGVKTLGREPRCNTEEKVREVSPAQKLGSILMHLISLDTFI